MNIATGAHLNHYEIVALLGVGGMGEVYKANDTKLGRPVALKILPAHLVEDADRVRRFIQEAKSASALNHPHIITIYEIGEAEIKDNGEGADSAMRIHYIAMEFVDGSTLHTKIHRERADLKKLLEYFAQAGEGLAKAHAAGIVHRDLKPENIMITDDGYAKILDFGLAKLIESSEPSGGELEEAATAMMGQTRPGMVMGTVGYMSPEQAQGKAVDQRSDIFSFGCILYEAATGRKPFTGDSMIDSLHKIVYMQASPIRESNPNAPPELQRIVRKCLAKDPGERYQSIRDLAIDLRDLVREYDSQQSISMSFPPAPPSGSYPQPQSTGSHSQASVTESHSQFAPTMMHPQTATTGSQESLSSGPVSGAVVAPRKSNRLLKVGAGLLVLALLAAGIYFLVSRKQSGGRTGPPFQTTRITKLTSTGKSSGAVISPDGKYVAHFVAEAGQPSVWVRQVATSSNVQIVPPADVGYVGLTFSRDGNYVYYVRSLKGQTLRTLYQVPVLGGTAKQIVVDVDSAITFSPDGKRFAFVRGNPRNGEMALMVANADGTDEQTLAVKKQPDSFLQPAWSPDGKVIASTVRTLTGGYHMELVEIQVATGAERAITSQKWLSIAGLDWLSDGSGIIMSALEEKPTSSYLQIWQVSYPSGATRRITNDLNNYAGVSLSSDSNMMVTVQAQASSNIWLAPNGDATRARQITSGSNSYEGLSWTPDGRIVYVTNANGPPDVWIMDSDGKNQKQLTTDAGVNIFSSVSPDGRYVLFDSSRNSGTLNTFYIWRMNIDGSNPKQLTQSGNEYFPVCSPDGKWVLYTPLNDLGKPSVWRVSIDGGDPVRLTDYISIRPVISPDGKFIACQYHDEQPGSLVKVAIIPFEGGQPTKVLNIQTSQYQWSSDGKAIIYLDTKGGVSNIWSLPIDGGAARQLTNFTNDMIFNFDWSRDGKQVICARGVQNTDVVLIKDQGNEETRNAER